MGRLIIVYPHHIRIFVVEITIFKERPVWQSLYHRWCWSPMSQVIVGVTSAVAWRAPSTSSQIRSSVTSSPRDPIARLPARACASRWWTWRLGTNFREFYLCAHGVFWDHDATWNCDSFQDMLKPPTRLVLDGILKFCPWSTIGNTVRNS